MDGREGGGVGPLEQGVHQAAPLPVPAQGGRNTVDGVETSTGKEEDAGKEHAEQEVEISGKHQLEKVPEATPEKH